MHGICLACLISGRVDYHPNRMDGTVTVSRVLLDGTGIVIDDGNRAPLIFAIAFDAGLARRVAMATRQRYHRPHSPPTHRLLHALFFFWLHHRHHFWPVSFATKKNKK